MEWELVVALLTPLLLALLFRVPRRTQLLTSEVEVLSRLAPRTKAHRLMKEHVEHLVEREIEANKNWLVNTTIVQVILAFSYGALLLVVGLDLGGWWLIAAAMGGLILALLVLSGLLWILPSESRLFRWLRQVFRVA